MNIALLTPALLIVLGPGHADGFVDPDVAKRQALTYERRADWGNALSAWQSILDRAEPGESLRFETVGHVHDLNLRVPPSNLSARSSKAWPTLIVIFRNVNLDWKDEGGQVHHFQSHFTDREIESIHRGFGTFCTFVSRFTHGIRRIEPTFKVVDEPVTAMEGKGSFWLGPGIPKETLLRFMKGVDFQSVFTYEKFSEGDERLPRAFAGGSYGADVGLNAAAYSDILWDEKEETDGEVELHEWLHQIDWMFPAVLGYPREASISPDMGKRIGEDGGDTDFRRSASALNWVDFYRHIMEDHVTPTMWREATMHNPRPNPWLNRKAKSV